MQQLKKVEVGLGSTTDQHLFLVPLTWTCKTVDEARLDGFIRTDLAQQQLTDQILIIRDKCSRVIGYYNNNIPLVYTQVGYYGLRAGKLYIVYCTLLM